MWFAETSPILALIFYLASYRTNRAASPVSWALWTRVNPSYTPPPQQLSATDPHTARVQHILLYKGASIATNA